MLQFPCSPKPLFIFFYLEIFVKVFVTRILDVPGGAFLFLEVDIDNGLGGAHDFEVSGGPSAPTVWAGLGWE